MSNIMFSVRSSSGIISVQTRYTTPHSSASVSSRLSARRWPRRSLCLRSMRPSRRSMARMGTLSMKAMTPPQASDDAAEASQRANPATSPILNSRNPSPTPKPTTISADASVERFFNYIHLRHARSEPLYGAHV